MQDPFEAAEFFGVPEDALREPLPVDRAGLAAHPRECRLDGEHRGPAAAKQAMHDSIGVEQRHAEMPQHRRGGAFTHADRAGEAEDDHRVPMAPRVVRMAARNSRVTWTGLPNHASKPGLP